MQTLTLKNYYTKRKLYQTKFIQLTYVQVLPPNFFVYVSFHLFAEPPDSWKLFPKSYWEGFLSKNQKKHEKYV